MSGRRGDHGFCLDWKWLGLCFFAGAMSVSACLVLSRWKERRHEGESQGPSTGAATRGDRSSLQRPDRPDEPSLDFDAQRVIARLKHLASRPRHALATLELEALIESIPVERIPELVALGKRELSEQQRDLIYLRLLDRWLAEDAVAAMDFVLGERIDEQTDDNAGINLRNRLFNSWIQRDPDAASDWLLENWNHKVLQGGAFMSSLGRHWAEEVADHLLRGEGVAAAFAFIERIEDPADRHAAIGGCVGQTPWRLTWRNIPVERRIELHHRLMQIENATERSELVRSLWKEWAQADPDEVRQQASRLGAADQFEIARALLAARHQHGTSSRTASGGTLISSKKVEDVDERVQAVLDAGDAAGMPRSEALLAVAEVLAVSYRDRVFDWIDEHGGEMEIEGFLAHQARAAAGMGHSENLNAIRWASRIEDQELRASLCRAAYRRMIRVDHEAAQNYLQNGDPPPDLLESFQSILEGTP